MLLLLIRHAIAEERGAKPDGLRALTEEGRRKIEKAYPNLCEALKHSSVRLISSPLVRAQQTSEVLETCLGIQMEQADWVVRGDTLELLKAVEQTQEEILMVVGHEPTLSDWCERFGFSVGWMKKGSIAFFQVNESIQPIGYVKVKDLMEGIPLNLYEIMEEINT